MIALLGNLSRDLRPGQPPQAGGGPTYSGRALARFGISACVYARCKEEDREELFDPLVSAGIDARYVSGTATACFEFSYVGERREMNVVAAGDVWEPGDLPAIPAEVEWIHVAPLLRSDFPADTLAALAPGRRVLLDGQGLVRSGRLGQLSLDADFDPELLRHLAAVKLSDREAEVLGDPAALPVPEVLVTNGSRGATVYTRGRSERVFAEVVDADPTGSGDAFSSLYVAARAEGHPPVDAARRAVRLVSQLLRER